MRLRCTTVRSDYGVSKRRRSEFRIVTDTNIGPDSGCRLRSANILLVSVRALANEVAKNLVLAGIGSLTIIDHEPVTEDDLDAQFFLEEAQRDEDIIKKGMNVSFFVPLNIQGHRV